MISRRRLERVQRAEVRLPTATELAGAVVPLIRRSTVPPLTWSMSCSPIHRRRCSRRQVSRPAECHPRAAASGPPKPRFVGGPAAHRSPPPPAQNAGSASRCTGQVHRARTIRRRGSAKCDARCGTLATACRDGGRARGNAGPAPPPAAIVPHGGFRRTGRSAGARRRDGCHPIRRAGWFCRQKGSNHGGRARPAQKFARRPAAHGPARCPVAHRKSAGHSRSAPIGVSHAGGRKHRLFAAGSIARNRSARPRVGLTPVARGRQIRRRPTTRSPNSTG